MDRDEMIERGARALRATFYPSRTIRQTPEDEWKRRAAAVVDAITPDEYEQVGCEACDGTGGENSALCGCGPGVRHVVDCGTRPRPCSTCNGEGYVKVAAPPEGDEG